MHHRDGAQRDVDSKPDVRATAVGRLQRLGYDPDGQSSTRARLESAPGRQVTRVASLKRGYGEFFRRLGDIEVVGALAGDVKSCEPRIALRERHTRFDEQRVRRVIGFCVAAPCECRCPESVASRRTVIGRRGGHTIHIDAWMAVFPRFRLVQPPRRDLEGKTRRRQVPHPT